MEWQLIARLIGNVAMAFGFGLILYLYLKCLLKVKEQQNIIEIQNKELCKLRKKDKE